MLKRPIFHRQTNRGDIAILMAFGFTLLTLAMVNSHQLLSGQRRKLNRRLVDSIVSYGNSEINAWHGFYRSRAALPAPATGPTSINANLNNPGATLAKSPYVEPRQAPTPGNGTKYCGGSKMSQVCISPPLKWVPIIIPAGIGWTQQAYLKASNADNNDNFGYEIGLNQDTLIVGAYREESQQTTIDNGTTSSSDNNMSLAGAAYVYKRTTNSWAQEAYLKNPVLDLDLFGSDVAIDGDTASVGSAYEDSNQTSITSGAGGSANNGRSNSGAVWIFSRTNGVWSQQAYVKPSNANAGDNFGGVTALSGNTLAVGALREDSRQTSITLGSTASADILGSTNGAVYIFQLLGGNWQQTAYLKAPNTNTGDNFGVSVGLDANRVAVGAHNEDANQTSITNGNTASPDNTAPNSGAVYVFRKTLAVSPNPDTWAMEAYLKAPNANQPLHSARFGFGTALDQDTILVAAPFEASNQTSISNGIFASMDTTQNGSGAAFVFRNVAGVWTHEAYIKASNAEGADNFGLSCGLSNDRAVIGSPYEDSGQTYITNGTASAIDNAINSSGAAFVYKRTANTWAQEAYIKLTNPDTNDANGFASSISSKTVVVAMPYEDSPDRTIINGTGSSGSNLGTDSGAAFVYTHP